MGRFMLCILIFLSVYVYEVKEPVHATTDIHVSAQQAVLMDQHTGRIIYGKKAHERRPIASITKVMTAILALEHGHLDELVTTSERATTVGGSSIYLTKDEQMTLEDLLYGLMLRSGNDAAVAISEHIAGSVEGFTYLMNEKALYLGMTNTHFMNPHGLDETDHYSSAYDMALLTRYAMENESFRKISETKAYQSENRDYKWFNKNKLLTHLYRHSTGGKTGFTNKAGRTLVSTAKKDELSLIVVTLHAPNDWNDHIHLYETYFERLTTVLLERKGRRSISSTKDDSIDGFMTDPVILSLTEEEIPLVKKQVMIHPSPNPSVIGSMRIQIEDETVLSVPIYRPFHWREQLTQLFHYVVGSDL